MIKTVLKIDGMMCSMCEAHINDAIRRTVPNAKKVKSSHKKGTAEFITDKNVNAEALKKALSELGYTCLSVGSAEYKKKGIFG